MSESTGYGNTIDFAGGLIARFMSVNWSGFSREEIDYTNAASPDGYAESKPGDIKKPGSLEVELLFDPADLASWIAAMDADPESVTVTYQDGGSLTCNAYLTEFENEAPHDDKMTASATIVFTGPIT
jgi:hypothetical protein